MGETAAAGAAIQAAAAVLGCTNIEMADRWSVPLEKVAEPQQDARHVPTLTLPMPMHYQESCNEFNNYPCKIKPPKQPLKVPAEAGIAVVFLLVMLGGFIATPNFLTVSNMMVLLLNGAVIGFLCPTILCPADRGIDLSCGSIVAMTCVVAALLMEKFGIPWQLAVPIVLAVGALSGLVNGLIIERTGVPPFIVTFAMMGLRHPYHKLSPAPNRYA